MSIQKNVDEIVDRFSQFSDWEDRYKEIILIGKELDAPKEELLIEKFEVKGCQSKVWLIPSYQNGQVYFQCFSDAVLVKGIIALLVKVYSEHTPQEILEYKHDFLKEIGISEHLSMNRTNGLAAMLKQIKMYAFAFQSLAEKGIKDANI